MIYRAFSLIELMVVIAIIAILAAVAVPIYYNYICHSQAQEGLGALATTKTSWAALRSTGRFNSNDNDFSSGINMQKTLSIELPERNWAYSVTSVSSNQVTVHVMAEGTSLKDCLLVPALNYDFIVRYSNGNGGGVRTGVTFHIENSSDDRFIKNKH